MTHRCRASPHPDPDPSADVPYYMGIGGATDNQEARLMDHNDLYVLDFGEQSMKFDMSMKHETRCIESVLIVVVLPFEPRSAFTQNLSPHGRHATQTESGHPSRVDQASSDPAEWPTNAPSSDVADFFVLFSRQVGDPSHDATQQRHQAFEQCRMNGSRRSPTLMPACLCRSFPRPRAGQSCTEDKSPCEIHNILQRAHPPLPTCRRFL